MYALLRSFCCLLWLSVRYSPAIAQKATHDVCSVYFATDKYDLTDQSKSKLDSLVKQVNASVDYTLDISANTDADGTNTYNDILSWNRAKSVEAYLMSKGMVINKMRAKGLGESAPLYDNVTETGKAGNRRVDINSVLYSFENISQVMDAIETKAEEHFTINATKENVIKGRNGTTVKIPANAFVTADGTPVKSTIDFEVKEALNTDDILFANLSTTSDNTLLQTGGMVYIQATANGQKLLLAKDKSVTITIPAVKKADGMQLFYGEKKTDGSINWKPTGQKPKPDEVAIDITKLKQIKLHQTAIPTVPLYTSLPAKPVYPAPPAKPVEPREPTDMKYIPTWGEKFFCMHRRIRRKQDALNQPMQDAYDRLMERYETNMDKYATGMVHYDYVVFPKYYDDSMVYRNALHARATEINNYLKKYSSCLAARIVQKTIEGYVARPITADTRFTLPYQNDYNRFFNTRNYVIEQVGRENVWIGDGYYYIDNVVLKDGSVIPVNFNVMVAARMYDIADSLGLTKLMTEYDRELYTMSINGRGTQTEAVSNYVFTVNQMNWINCDRFLNTPTPMMVKVKETEDARIYVVCDSINSYLGTQRYDDYYQSPNLPAKTKITIVAVKVKDGRLQVATKSAVAGDQKMYDLQYTDCNMAQLKSLLKKV